MHEIIFKFDDDESTIIELLEGLPVIENLHTSTWVTQVNIICMIHNWLNSKNKDFAS